MSFQIHALPTGDFQKYFNMDAAELAAHSAQIHQVETKPGAPCRVRLEDAEIGERVVLVNYQHQPADSPYQSSHAVYVSENAVQSRPSVGEVPDVLVCRTLSVRGFDADDCIQEADLVDGTVLGQRLDAIFADEQIEYVHVHYAQRGCFAAKATRA
jgi:hypothetical protein